MAFPTGGASTRVLFCFVKDTNESREGFSSMLQQKCIYLLMLIKILTRSGKRRLWANLQVK